MAIELTITPASKIVVPETSPRAKIVTLAAGLGLTNRVIIDQHFRQRDRLGRLLTALAYNPFAIGIGLTAMFSGLFVSIVVSRRRANLVEARFELTARRDLRVSRAGFYYATNIAGGAPPPACEPGRKLRLAASCSLRLRRRM